MKKSRELSKASDIVKEADCQKDSTEKLSQEGEKKVKNVERLNKTAEIIAVNLPKEEQQRLKKEMEKAYKEGEKDYKETEKEMGEHLKDENEQVKEFDEAKKDAKEDQEKLKRVERESKGAAFYNEIKEMEDNIGKIAQDFTKASKEMLSDAGKGQDTKKKQTERVVRAKPKLTI